MFHSQRKWLASGCFRTAKSRSSNVEPAGSSISDRKVGFPWNRGELILADLAVLLPPCGSAGAQVMSRWRPRRAVQARGGTTWASRAPAYGLGAGEAGWTWSDWLLLTGGISGSSPEPGPVAGQLGDVCVLLDQAMSSAFPAKVGPLRSAKRLQPYESAPTGEQGGYIDRFGNKWVVGCQGRPANHLNGIMFSCHVMGASNLDGCREMESM